MDAPTNATPRPRGCVPSPAWKLDASPAHQATATPNEFLALPATLSYWGNDTYGDCVTAEEMFAKAAWFQYPGVGGAELFIDEATAIAWANGNGFLNGASITDVMDAMISQGIRGQDTANYRDGAYESVNWTVDATLRSAIYQGPVKIGISADQLEAVVGSNNGWFLTGAKNDKNEDHCISLCGFGTVNQLAAALNVPVPAGVTGSSLAYAAFTWNTVGIIDRPSLLAITAEAWVRNPTTPQQPPTPTPAPTPAPTPDPTPTPVPTPMPTPTPDTTDEVMTINFSKNTITTQNINFRHTWYPKGTGTITLHQALGTSTIPQKFAINGVSFPN